MQLNKFLAHAGVCSRRKAVELIVAGEVTINGKRIVEPGYQVKEADQVAVQGKRLMHEKKVYLLLNKPKGYITTVSDERERRTVLDLIKPEIKQRVYPVGRLDRNTTGVLLLTNDGELANRLSHPSHGVQKTYLVTLDAGLTATDLEKIKKGVHLDDGKVVLDMITLVRSSARKELRITLHSGKYRVIRRLFDHLGYKVVKLDRIRYAGLTKAGVPLGAWRELDDAEVEKLRGL